MFYIRMFLVGTILFTVSCTTTATSPKNPVLVPEKSVETKNESQTEDVVETDNTKTEEVDFNLPISFDPEKNDLHKIVLPNEKYPTMDPSLSYDDGFVARLPAHGEFKPVIFSQCTGSGHCDEWLLVYDSENDISSTLPIYFNTAPDGNMPNVTFCVYEIKPGYQIELKYSDLKKDDDGNTIDRKDRVEIYEIDENGQFVKYE